MRNFILLFLLSVVVGCTKKSSSTSPSLNTTETKLVGTWFKTKEIDTTGLGVQTHTYSGNTNYLQFKEESYGYTKDSKLLIYAPTLLIDAGTTGGTTGQGYWYYDDATSYLTMVTKKVKIVSITSSDLVLQVDHSLLYYKK